MPNRMICSMLYLVGVTLHTAALNGRTQLKRFCWCHNFTHGCPSMSILRRLWARCYSEMEYKDTALLSHSFGAPCILPTLHTHHEEDIHAKDKRCRFAAAAGSLVQQGGSPTLDKQSYSP